MNHAFEGRILGVAFLIAFAVPAARAQVSTVELHGLVRDPSANVVVPGTQIRVQNLDTGLTRTVLTRENGSYSFFGLRPGRYSVYVEASGFRPALTKEIVLNVGQRADLSFRLEGSPRWCGCGPNVPETAGAWSQ